MASNMRTITLLKFHCFDSYDVDKKTQGITNSQGNEDLWQ